MHEHHQYEVNMWDRAQNWFRSLLGKNEEKLAAEQPEDIENPCCAQPLVHIAFRGKSDDRLYLTENRRWNEVRYYQPHGLRVFCAQCRRRLL